jgi:hypothetical protein
MIRKDRQLIDRAGVACFDGNILALDPAKLAHGIPEALGELNLALSQPTDAIDPSRLLRLGVDRQG